MKIFNRFTLIILCCLFHLSNNAQQVGSPIFLVTANDYSSGLMGFNSVSTSSSNVNAAFTNPALMVNSQMNISLNRGIVGVPSFDYKSQFSEITAYKNIGNHAFGMYLKAVQFSDFTFISDTTLGENNFMSGFAYAYKLSDNWSLGANLNYYAGQFRNEVLAKTKGFENYQGFTLSFGGLYQDDFEINDISSVNWSVGANINNLGHKNASVSDRKNKEFIWSQAGFGASIGYKRKSEIHPFTTHITLLSQTNFLLHPGFRDDNNDGINDRETLSALQGVIAAFDGSSYHNIDLHTGLEVNILLEKDWNFGFRMTYIGGISFGGNLYPAFFVGYKNFYLSAGHSMGIGGRILSDVNENGISLGYNVPL